MVEKIDSNFTGLAFAEEETLKVLPGTLEADAVWHELEPNSYSDFGGELSLMARSPINASRQKKKGTITSLDASGGFNIDVTQNNLTKLLQGFFFADAHEKFSTKSLNDAAILITETASGDKSYSAAAGLDDFKPGDIILCSGFGVGSNNGIKVVATAAAGKITVAETVTTEAAPPAAAKIEVVGFQFGAGDLDITASASAISLTCTAGDFTTLGLVAGEWIFIGGDAAGLAFTTNLPGYARIASIAAKVLTLSNTTFAATTENNGAGTLQIFFGTVLMNESDPANIVRRSYNLERSLGEDDDGTQSELLLGAIPNELTFNIPQGDKLNADLSFVAMDNVQRTGDDEVKAGDRIAALGEAAFNTSSDIFRLRMNVVDPTTLNNSSLFGYVSEMKLSVKNNVSPAKAVGVLGAFEASVGDFEVSGSLTAYFSTVAAIAAVRANSDVALSAILAKENAGLVIDVPLVSLGGGRLGIEKDTPIKVPLESSGAQNALGYTMLMTNFPYLPSVGMPA